MSNRSAIRIAFAGLVCLLSATANAQLFRAYVSIAGSDANPCTLQAPCRLLPAALAAVEAGGEIWMLDSGNYNTATVTIAKSVTILAVPGALGSVVGPAGGHALVVPTSNVKVTLRNLVVRPFGAVVNGQSGIVLQADTSYLVVQNCNVSGFKAFDGAGIRAAGQSTMDVTDTVVQDVYLGIHSEGGAFVTISSSRIYGAEGNGIASQATTPGITTSVTVSDSVIARSGSAGSAFSSAGAARLTITRSTLSHNATGFFANRIGGEATGSWSANAVVGNGAGFTVLGGSVLESHGNNTVRNNGPNTGALTPVANN